MALTVPAHASPGYLEEYERDYLGKNKVVAHIRVISAKEASFMLEQSRDSCGTNYEAIVLETFKGKLKKELIEFSSSSSLYAGSEYLLYMGREKSPRSITVQWPADYEKAFNECKKGLNEPALDESNFSPVLNYPGELKGTWIEIIDYNIEFKRIKPEKGSCERGPGECLFVKLEEVKKRAK